MKNENVKVFLLENAFLKNGLKIYILIPIIPFHSDLDDKEDMTTSFSVSVDEWHINKEATR